VPGSSLAETVLPEQAGFPAPPAAPACCAQCRAPLISGPKSICKRCGWFAPAGAYIPLDGEAIAWDDLSLREAARVPLPSKAWLLLASVAAVFIGSTIVENVTPDGSLARSNWAAIQLILGVVAVMLCQVVGVFVLLRNDATVGLLDAVLRPLAVIDALVRQLPRTFWVLNTGLMGAAAVVAAIGIIGNVPYHALWSWDWQFDRATQQSLSDAIDRRLDAAQRQEASLTGSTRKTVDCVIIGYSLSGDGQLRNVLLARNVLGQLIYVGGVSPGDSADYRRELLARLEGFSAPEPVIPVHFDAKWVRPKLSCRISYGFEQENRKLTNIRWEGKVRRLGLAAD
jgi:hypothetical protein